MVDLTRRKTVIGLGLLATGSGATFTSAAFSDSTTATSDIRIVANEALEVRYPQTKTEDNDIETEAESASDATDYIFGSSSDILGSVNFGDVTSDGAAAVTGNTKNGDLEVAIAGTDSLNREFKPILEVVNNGDTDVNVGITIDQFGTDTTANGGDVYAPNVDSALSFEIEDSNGTYQSVSATSGESVGSGETRGISFVLDFANNIDSSNITSATSSQGPGSDVFSNNGAAADTIDLVDQIRIGTNPS